LRKSFSRLALYLAIALAFLVLYFVLLPLPHFGDFGSIFYPALFLSDPYSEILFLNPPWVLAILYPLRLLSVTQAGAAWMSFSLLVTVFSIHRLKGDALAYLLTFTNPFFAAFLTQSNLDVLILLGLIIETRPFDILLLTIKPQIVVTAIAYKLHQYGRKEWLWLVMAGVLSLLIWGFWPNRMFYNWQHGLYQPVSLDIFPFGLLIGTPLLYLAWKRDSLHLVALTGYFFTPYVSHGSIFVYTVLIFATFTTSYRLIIYAALWLFAIAVAWYSALFIL
jgi:hypothetical protein